MLNKLCGALRVVGERLRGKAGEFAAKLRLGNELVELVTGS